MIQNACMRGLRKVSNKKNRRSVRSACFEMDAAVPCGTSQRRELLQFLKCGFVLRDNILLRRKLHAFSIDNGLRCS